MRQGEVEGVRKQAGEGPSQAPRQEPRNRSDRLHLIPPGDLRLGPTWEGSKDSGQQAHLC